MAFSFWKLDNGVLLILFGSLFLRLMKRVGEVIALSVTILFFLKRSLKGLCCPELVCHLLFNFSGGIMSKKILSGTHETC